MPIAELGVTHLAKSHSRHNDFAENPEDYKESKDNSEIMANARLIAASPCTHSAALPFIAEENRLPFMGDKDGRIYLSVTKEEYEAMQAAIAKATENEGA